MLKSSLKSKKHCTVKYLKGSRRLIEAAEALEVVEAAGGQGAAGDISAPRADITTE
jgi:hypothetical protein